MFAASKTAAAVSTPSATNPPFNYVTLLLHGDGTNGSQNNTFVDGSPNNYAIIRAGTSTQGSFSPYGTLWSNYFDGDGDYLTIANNAALNMGTSSFTIEAWVYLTAAPGDTSILGGIILDKDGLAGSSWPQYALSIRSTRRAVFQASAAPATGGAPQSSITSSSILELHTWYHIAATRSGTTATLWVNGVSEGTTSAVPSNLTTNSRPLLIGWTNRGTPAPPFNFPGYISNLRIVKGTVVYTGNFTPSTTPLTAITNTSLLTCQSNRFLDASSNNFAITRAGTPSVQRFSPFSPTAAYSTSVIGGSGYFSPTSYISPTTSNIVNFGTGNFTVEMWVYAASGNYNFFDGRSAGAQNAITLFLNSDGTIAFLNNNGTVRINAAGFIFGAWNHIAVSRSGTSVRLFCNGVQIGSTFTDSSTYISGTNRPTVGAGGFTVGSSPLTGYIGGLRVVKAAVYTANFTPPTAPPTAIINTALLLNFINAGIFDNAMMNNLVTVGNAQVSTAVVKYGTGSMAFDGTGDYLTMPDTPNLNFGTGDFTIELWINFNSGAGATFSRAITKGTYQASATVWGLAITRSTGLITFSTGNPDVATNIGNLANGVWTHIAVTRSGTTLRTFFNGVLNQTVTNTVNYESTFALRVGSDLTGVDNLAGYIDDLRITKGLAVYTASFVPPTAAFPDF